MTTTDWRKLCAELTDELSGYASANPHHDSDALVTRARAALAKPEPEVVGPTDQELADAFAQGCRDGSKAGEPPFLGGARAILARFGHQPAPPAEGADCPACEGVPKPGNQPCAVCGRSALSAEGEVAELAWWLRSLEDACVWFEPGSPEALKLTRAAELLEQRHPTPVPMAERLPEPVDCDAEGRCWWGFEETDDYEASWTLRKMIGLPFDDTHWLPANALPLPAGEAQP